MQYKDDEAHLLLLAVDPVRRRKGIGRALMQWLEATALTAGIGLIHLEARTGNAEARAFYRKLGYLEIKSVPGLYAPGEDGVRIAKDLWLREYGRGARAQRPLSASIGFGTLAPNP